MRRSSTITLKRSTYDGLLQRIEDLEDAMEMRTIETQAHNRRYLPDELVGRRLEGEHPLRLWREHRQLTMEALAKRARTAQSYISEIETGKKPGSVAALKRLADALDVTIDDIVV